ncbi:E3 ubiquitin-protein ligase NRDP1-like [Dendronephthya gigantea]|uniref:E3 ubiquitin-protein ligase NRDP1-like n=1 Tax=Dendronephthya gigantea TaxID=151771 RepID=UPI00106B6453|nr:E3 ubiquitin-protein ligase NRDP1-like [Dendronephthya gigantea]
MAAHGYEEERFEVAVSKSFRCPICYSILKDPVMCRQNQHTFCRCCITKHLVSLSTTKDCPVCKEQLSLDTLSDPPRILTDYLSELKIRCEFFERGCKEFVELQNLARHTEACGYAPEVCSNPDCQVEVNRRDLIHHECMECEERKLKCHSCDRMSGDVAQIKQVLKTVNEKVGVLENTCETMCENVCAAVNLIAEKFDSFQKKFDSFQKKFHLVVESQKEMKTNLQSLKRRFPNQDNTEQDLPGESSSSPKRSKLENDDSAERADNDDDDEDDDDEDDDNEIESDFETDDSDESQAEAFFSPDLSSQNSFSSSLNTPATPNV